MPQIRNPHAHRLIPEKYDKNQFTATAWYHIDKYWRHRGEHLSYEKFKHLDDPLARQCRQNVFEETLASYKLDLVLTPETAPPPPIKLVSMDEPTSKQNLGDLIIDGLKTQQDRFNRQGEIVPPKKEPISAARRQEAAEWIWAHINESFVGFRAVFEEPELDLAWWSKMRAEGLRKEHAAKELAAPDAPAASAAAAAQPTTMENSMANTEIVFDGRVKEPVKKVARYLLTLGTADKIRGMTAGVYQEKTKHRDFEPYQFAKARELVLRHLDGIGDKRRTGTAAAPAAAPAATTNAPAAVATRAKRNGHVSPYAGRTATVVLASVSTAVVSKVDTASIRTFVLDILAQVAPEQPAPQIVFMTDPPTMEVRAQVQL